MGVSITKIVIWVAVQIMCSYITFPLYALVTQMGSHMKRSIFNEQTSKALTNWRKVAKEKKKARDADMLLARMSPEHLLHRAEARSDSGDPQSAPAEEEGRDMHPAVAHPVHRVHPRDRLRSTSSPALDAHIPGADFSFGAQR